MHKSSLLPSPIARPMLWIATVWIWMPSTRNLLSHWQLSPIKFTFHRIWSKYAQLLSLPIFLLLPFPSIMNQTSKRAQKEHGCIRICSIWQANEGLKRRKNIPLKCSFKQHAKLSECYIFYPLLLKFRHQGYQWRSDPSLVLISSLYRPVQYVNSMGFQRQVIKEA